MTGAEGFDDVDTKLGKVELPLFPGICQGNSGNGISGGGAGGGREEDIEGGDVGPRDRSNGGEEDSKAAPRVGDENSKVSGGGSGGVSCKCPLSIDAPTNGGGGVGCEGREGEDGVMGPEFVFGGADGKGSGVKGTSATRQERGCSESVEDRCDEFEADPCDWKSANTSAFAALSV